MFFYGGGLGAAAGGLRLGGPSGPMEGPKDPPVHWRFFVTDAPMNRWTDRHTETFSFYIDTAK